MTWSFIWLVLMTCIDGWIPLNRSKGQCKGPYSVLYSVVLNCPKLLHHAIYSGFLCFPPNFKWCWVTLKVIFKVGKVQFGPVWHLWTDISETVACYDHCWNTSTKLYIIIQFIWWLLTLDDPFMSNKGHRIFKRYLINLMIKVCMKQLFLWKSYMALQFTS